MGLTLYDLYTILVKVRSILPPIPQTRVIPSTLPEDAVKNFGKQGVH
jgi:hypothetical protein